MIIYCIAGIIAGIFTGLIPGLHTNNVALMLVASPLFGMEFAAFLLSMSIVHTFVDFIPTVFIGAPGADTFEGVLPAHRLFLKGQAFEAVGLTVFGGMIALVGSLLFVPLFFAFIEKNSEGIVFLTPFILIFALIVLVGTEKKKVVATFIIFSAALYGIFFSGQIFPLITGFFGIPTVLFSLKESPGGIFQEGNFVLKKEMFKEGLIGIIGGAVVSVIPGIGNNVAASIIKIFRGKIESENYLVLLGSINTSNFFFSFATLLALSKARNGVMLALQEKLVFSPNLLLVGMGIMVFAGSLGAVITLILSKRATSFFSVYRIKIISIVSIVIMVGMVFLFNGFYGLLALFFSTGLGLFGLTKKVKRSCCMASLIAPTILFYVFFLI